LDTNIKGAFIVYFKWQTDGKVVEFRQPFNSLEELMEFCAKQGEARVIDRIMIESNEPNGQTRTLNLVFQSLSVQRNSS
jgi:hypothetical protein